VAGPSNKAEQWLLGRGRQSRQVHGNAFYSGQHQQSKHFQESIGRDLCIVLTLKYLMAGWEPKSMTISIVCNGKSAVDQLNSTN